MSYRKTMAVINSCETVDHLFSARRYASLECARIGDGSLAVFALNDYLNKIAKKHNEIQLKQIIQEEVQRQLNGGWE